MRSFVCGPAHKIQMLSIKCGDLSKTPPSLFPRLAESFRILRDLPDVVSPSSSMINLPKIPSSTALLACLDLSPDADSWASAKLADYLDADDAWWRMFDASSPRFDAYDVSVEDAARLLSCAVYRIAPACHPARSNVLVEVWTRLGRDVSSKATTGRLTVEEAASCLCAMEDALAKGCIVLETSEERCARFFVTAVSGATPAETDYSPLEYAVFALRAKKLRPELTFVDGKEAWIRDTVLDGPQIDGSSPYGAVSSLVFEAIATSCMHELSGELR